MDMQEPSKFTAMPWLKRTKRSHGALYSLPMLMLCWGVWMLVNSWSVWVVGKGLISTGNFHEFPDWAMYVFASCIQLVVAIGFMYMTMIFRHGYTGWLSSILTITICCTMLLGEVFHQMIAQIKTGQGTSLLQVQGTQISQMQSQVTSIGAQVVNIYIDTTAGFQTNAQNAAKGFDQSRVAKKGKIYEGFINQFQTAQVYADLKHPIPSPIVSTDLRTQHTNLQSRLQSLASQQARLTEFLNATYPNQGRTPPANIVQGIAALQIAIRPLDSFYSKMNKIDERALAMEAAFAFPGKLWRGEDVNKQSVLAAGYGFASAMMLLVLGIVIRHINAKRSPGSTADVKTLVKEARAEKEAWDTLAQERMEADLAKVFADSSVRMDQ
jgi:hypothetical protein